MRRRLRSELGPVVPVLPASRTSFIGRAAERARLVRDLESSARLVTLVGVGGAGKTRLALEVARDLAASMPAGAVAFVDLSEALGADDLCRAVAEELGVTLEPGGSRQAAAVLLGRALARRGRTVLVLDNFEQLVESAAHVAALWLDLAPELVLLITSRELLRLPGEVVFDVPPLAVTAGSPAASEAAALFLDRARAARPGLRVEVEDARRIDEIVATLDGLPLAIELAAARMNVLSPAELCALLPRRFDLLSRGARGAPARQSSLTGAIDASWERLSQWERTTLAACSVFHGPFDRAAAEAVVDLSSHPDAPWLVDVLAALRDKSLLLVRDAPAVEADQDPLAADASATGAMQPFGGATSRVVFGMYLSIRDYAAERLAASGGLGAARARYARHYIERARAHARGLYGDGGRRHLERLLADHDHLAVIQDGFIRDGTAGSDAGSAGFEALSLALEAMVVVAPLFDFRGPVDSQLARLDAALLHPDLARVDVQLAAEARLSRGKLRRLGGMLGPSREDLESVLAFVRGSAGDDDGRRGAARELACVDRARLEARVLTELAFVDRAAGQMLDAQRSAEAALACLASAGIADPEAEGIARGLAARCRHSHGALEAAMPLYRAALAALEASGNRWAEALLLGSFGFLCQDLGALDDADTHYQRALAIHRAMGNRRGEGVVLGYVGNIHRRRGRIDDAIETYAEAVALLRQQGDEEFEGVFHMDWGILLAAHGRAEDAIPRFEEARLHVARSGNERCEALVLGHLGALHADAGRTDAATGCFLEARRKLTACADPHFARVVEILSGQLDVALARAARADGDEAQAVALVAAARARLQSEQPGIDRGRPAPPSEHVVFARHLLARAVDRADPPLSALVVAEAGQWFRTPGAPAVDIGGRQPLRRMLVALADERARAPGAALTTDALFAAGWPGERIQRAAKQNRVRVAVATLRKLGLEAVLLRGDAGWLLDPAVDLVRG